MIAPLPSRLTEARADRCNGYMPRTMPWGASSGMGGMT